MNKYEHLPLIKHDISIPRKKKQPFFRTMDITDFKKQKDNIQNEIHNVVSNIQSIGYINPELIFKVEYYDNLDENSLERLDIHILSNIDQNRNNLIAFSSDSQLNKFYEKLSKYSEGIPEDAKNAHYANIFSNIISIKPLTREDRMGRRLKKHINNLDAEKSYWFNVELWITHSADGMREKINEYRDTISKLDGQVTDDSLSDSFCIIRVHCSPRLLDTLLEDVNIAEIDLTPILTSSDKEILNINYDDLEIKDSLDENSESICIIDSGIIENHPLIEGTVKNISTLFNDDGIDENGHGTGVASIALYGNIEQAIIGKKFTKRYHLLIAKILNRNNEFPENELIETFKEVEYHFPEDKLLENIIYDIIEHYYNNYNCRIFNISIGIKDDVYDSGRQFTLAQTIDKLCHDYDIVVNISAGNYNDYEINTIRSFYPLYLLDANARILNPATAVNAITVGSLSSAHVPVYNLERTAHIIELNRENEPAIFTRSGPGINNSIKPDFVVPSGNIIYNNMTKSFNNDGIKILNHSFMDDQNLFAKKCGTSFAAPYLAHLCANLMDTYPYLNSNTIRAMLADASDYPKESLELIELKIQELKNNIAIELIDLGKISKVDECTESLLNDIIKQNVCNEDLVKKINFYKMAKSEAIYRILGYGSPDKDKALYSTDNRVVMYIQDTIEFDKFNIYEIYIPDSLLIKGSKKISVSLAFNPPTRHTRKDYIAYDIEYRLVKGVPPEEIIKIYRNPVNEQESPELPRPSCEISLEPGPSKLQNSTLKKSTCIFKNNSFITDFCDDQLLYLIVTHRNKWANPTLNDNVNFSVVVSLEHLDDDNSIEINMYNEIKEHIDIRLKDRQRIKEKIR